MRRLTPLAGTLLLAIGMAASTVAAEPPTFAFSSVNIEYEGTKVWVPSTFVVKKGATVSIKLVNNVPSGQHGFSIPAYKVAEVVDKGQTKTVEFVADQEGIFPVMCHLHPAHIGGQLVVLP